MSAQDEKFPNAHHTTNLARQSDPAPDRMPATLVQAKTLLDGRNELMIAHGRSIYVLRLTRHGKLILTK